MEIIRKIKELPFPPTSFFTRETVEQIYAIPDSEIRYTKEEESHMERSIKNLDDWIAESRSLRQDSKVMVVQRAKIEETLLNSRRQTNKR